MNKKIALSNLLNAKEEDIKDLMENRFLCEKNVYVVLTKKEYENCYTQELKDQCHWLASESSILNNLNSKGKEVEDIEDYIQNAFDDEDSISILEIVNEVDFIKEIKKQNPYKNFKSIDKKEYKSNGYLIYRVEEVESDEDYWWAE